MQRALAALETHRAELQEERTSLLLDGESSQRQLRRMMEPDLTDLDVEILLTLPDGTERTARLFLGAEERWKRARDRVLSQWEELQRASQGMHRTRQLQQRFRELEAVHVEQQRALEQARSCCWEGAAAREAALNQRQMIRCLEERIRDAASWAGARAPLRDFALCKEKSQQDSLREVAVQLDILARREQRLQQGPCEAELANLLRQKTQRVSLLLDELEQLQRRPEDVVGAQLAAGRQLFACAQRAAEAAQASMTLELQCEELRGQTEALEAESQQAALSFARQLAGLEVQLADREARCTWLEQRVVASP